MYMPEDNQQMFDILAELRLYAAMNGLPELAEKLDDALVLLQTETRRCGRYGCNAPHSITDQA